MLQGVPQKGCPWSQALYRMFEYECFNSQMSSFGVIIAEQISINLQHMDRESQSLLTFTGFASIRCVIPKMQIINHAPSQ